MEDLNESAVKYRVKGGDVYPVLGETQTGEYLILGEKIA